MLVATLLASAKGGSPPSAPRSVINRMRSIHAMGYCSALKRRGILAPATAWMNLEDVMLSEISEAQKDA